MSKQSYPEALEKLLEQLKRLPSIGQLTAERIAFFIMKSDAKLADDVGRAMVMARREVKHCPTCFNVTQNTGPCDVCVDETRNKGIVCVVESPKDLLAFEKTNTFRGVYHCLLGRLQPTDGIGEDDLTIAALAKRCKTGNIDEVILATNPDLGGDATAMAVSRALEGMKVKVTRLARGVPVGFSLDLLSGQVLEEALKGRSEIAGS